MGCFGSFGERISKDFRQKELLPLKILFFVHISTVLVLYPYLTIHMRELGINVEETAIMSAVTPVIGVVMPPLAGLIADKIGNFKVMLALFSVFSGLSALLLLVVPIGRVTVTYPENLVLGMSCNSDNPLTFSLYEEYPCERSNVSLEADLTVQSCGFVCHAHVDGDDSEAILRSNFYDIKMHDVEQNKTKTVRYELTSDDYHIPIIFAESLNHEQLYNNEKYSTAIRKLSANSYYFPTPTSYNFTCLPGDDGKEYNCMFGNSNPAFRRNFKARVSPQQGDPDDTEESRLLFDTDYIEDLGRRKEATCSGFDADNSDHISVQLALMQGNATDIYKDLDLGSCSPRCITTTPRNSFCSNKNTVIELDVGLTFWTYLCVRVFIGIIGGTTYTMFEGAAIAILREYKADYGLQRMYASLGGMISSPLSGLLIDYSSEGKGYTDFRPIFFLYAGLKCLSAVLMLFINLEFKTPAKSVVADVMSVMNIELISLFVAAFLLGSAWGYIESFLFWLLQDLGGTKSLMGLTVTVGGVVGIPLLALSGPIIERFGHANIIFIGFLTYAVRLFGYSIIYNPWLSLIFESMECLTHSLCFTAAITYAARLSSVTTDTTVQGILGGLFYGVGKSAGSLVGGYLIKYCGMRGTFQIFSCVTAITAFGYWAFYHIYMKKRSRIVREDKEKRELEKIENGTKELSKAKEAENDKTLFENVNLAYTADQDQPNNTNK